MEVMQQDVRVKDFPQFIETLIEQFNSERFRVGFIKKDGSKRVGKFDLQYRVRWKQTDDTMYKRKGRARTTDGDEYLLAHDLDKKAPRNISYARMKWLNVGKKFYKIKHLKTKVKVIEFFINNKISGVYNVGDQNLSYNDLAKIIINKFGNKKA